MAIYRNEMNTTRGTYAYPVNGEAQSYTDPYAYSGNAYADPCAYDNGNACGSAFTYDSGSAYGGDYTYGGAYPYSQNEDSSSYACYDAGIDYGTQGSSRGFGAASLQGFADMARSTGYPVRVLIGIGSAVIGTALGVIGLWGSATQSSSLSFNGLFAFGLLFGLISYVLAGGIGRALKGAWKVAKFTWFVIPVFPIDLILGLCGLVVGIILFTAVPIIFVMQAVREKYGK